MTGLPAIKGKAYCGWGCGSRDTHARMEQHAHPGFGGVTLLRDHVPVYPWGDAYGVDEDKTFGDYEAVAAGDPDHDWRLQIDGPLADYTYQRQGEETWALVRQGRGFA